MSLFGSLIFIRPLQGRIV